VARPEYASVLPPRSERTEVTISRSPWAGSPRPSRFSRRNANWKARQRERHLGRRLFAATESRWRAPAPSAYSPTGTPRRTCGSSSTSNILDSLRAASARSEADGRWGRFTSEGSESRCVVYPVAKQRRCGPSLTDGIRRLGGGQRLHPELDVLRALLARRVNVRDRNHVVRTSRHWRRHDRVGRHTVPTAYSRVCDTAGRRCCPSRLRRTADIRPCNERFQRGTSGRLKANASSSVRVFDRGCVPLLRKMGARRAICGRHLPHTRTQPDEDADSKMSVRLSRSCLTIHAEEPFVARAKSAGSRRRLGQQVADLSIADTRDYAVGTVWRPNDRGRRPVPRGANDVGSGRGR